MIIQSVRRQEPHNLAAAIRHHVTDGTRGKVNRLADAELVFFQLGSPGLDEIAPFGAKPPPDRLEYSAKTPNFAKISLACRGLDPVLGSIQKTS